MIEIDWTGVSSLMMTAGAAWFIGYAAGKRRMRVLVLEEDNEINQWLRSLGSLEWCVETLTKEYEQRCLRTTSPDRGGGSASGLSCDSPSGSGRRGGGNASATSGFRSEGDMTDG